MSRRKRRDRPAIEDSRDGRLETPVHVQINAQIRSLRKAGRQTAEIAEHLGIPVEVAANGSAPQGA
jgi:hypothetical protein